MTIAIEASGMNGATISIVEPYGKGESTINMEWTLRIKRITAFLVKVWPIMKTAEQLGKVKVVRFNTERYMSRADGGLLAVYYMASCILGPKKGPSAATFLKRGRTWAKAVEIKRPFS